MNSHHVEQPGSPKERGAGLAEYALLLALIAIVCVTAVTTLGTTIATALGNAATIF